MKKTERKNIIDLPYSLHDTRVNKISVIENTIILDFYEGYYKANSDYELIKGYIQFSNIDLDYCYVSVFNLEDESNRLIGKRYNLENFSKLFTDINFEIVEETYGYNKSKFFGYIYEEQVIKECIVEIYHFDNMKYITE